MTEAKIKQRVAEANQKALDIMLSAETAWVGIKPALEAVPGMTKKTILHAGPPIEWDQMCQVQKRGVIGGVLHERLAETEEEAANLVARGEIALRPALDLKTVGAGVGIVTPSMVVNICRDRKTGKEGYCIPFEGRVGLGGWGVYDEDVEKHLQVLEKTFGPSVDNVLAACGGIDTISILARGTQMNDESHTRQVAEGLILVSEIVPHLVRADLEKDTLITCLDIIIRTDRFFHSLGMASAMSILRGIHGLEYSTIVTAMAGNGVEVGIKVSAMGDEWFTAPAPHLEGKYLSTKWSQKDAVPWLGDSCVMETIGLGGLAAAAGPVVIQLRGGSFQDAIQQTEEMRAICLGTNFNFPIPVLEFKGPPIGIDIRKILETGITPISHGGIVSKEGGQIGAGSARFPIECFQKAFYGFAERYHLM